MGDENIARRIVEPIVAIVNVGSQTIQVATRFMDVDGKCDELTQQMELVGKEEEDIAGRVQGEERRPGKKRRSTVDLFLEHVKRYKEDSENTISECGERRWINRMRWLPTVEEHLNRGKILLKKAKQIQEEGVVYDDIQTRAERLLVGELMGRTANTLLTNVLDAIQNGAVCIGIYGRAGAGKTNLMKHLYNKVYDDNRHFRAVYWATVPDQKPANYKDIQQSVAEGMYFHFDDEDEVRRASLIAMRVKADEGNPGRAILFLDNVKERFPSYELLGIPSCQSTSASNSAAILVFTAPTEDVCNMMGCDYKVKMDLLETDEARELFLHEAGLKDRNQDDMLSIEDVVSDVIEQCARMPLAIIVIGRSMAGINDKREWRHRLNVLKNLIENIYDDEMKILEQLRFSYLCLKDETTKRCFRAFAELIVDDQPLSKQVIIDYWISQGIICRRVPRDNANDQGYTILNRLERACLIEVLNVNGMVRMNKWIKKMATTMPDD